MPTVAEQFEGLIEYFQRAMEQTCWACSGSRVRTYYESKPVPCPICKGEGTRNGVDCSLCGGSGDWKESSNHDGPCDECGATGTKVVDRFDAGMKAAVLSAAISGAVTARESSEFARSNDILDWAHRYIVEAAVAAMQAIESDPAMLEQAKAGFAKAGKLEPKDLGVKFSGGALTPEELKDLLDEHAGDQ